MEIKKKFVIGSRESALAAVSYTHLDVYKRQPGTCSFLSSFSISVIGVFRDRKYRQETLARAVKINCSPPYTECQLLVM